MNMKRYIALLRGVNISGKNKVPMAELKKGFEGLGFGEVKTYLNSGNVIFSSVEENTEGLMHRIESMIKNQFSLDIPVEKDKTNIQSADSMHHVIKQSQFKMIKGAGHQVNVEKTIELSKLIETFWK